jgi:hypothetical protein
MTKLTVSRLIELADAARDSIAAGCMALKDEVYISPELIKEGDETTYDNRVHGGKVVEACVTTNIDSSQYIHIQLMGEPN